MLEYSQRFFQDIVYAELLSLIKFFLVSMVRIEKDLNLFFICPNRFDLMLRPKDTFKESCFPDLESITSALIPCFHEMGRQ